MNPAVREVGRRLRAAREACDMTQEAVADELGISHVSVGSWERAERRLTVVRLLQLADLYGVTPASLLPDSGTGPTSIPDRVRAIRLILDDIETHGGAA